MRRLFCALFVVIGVLFLREGMSAGYCGCCEKQQYYRVSNKKPWGTNDMSPACMLGYANCINEVGDCTDDKCCIVGDNSNGKENNQLNEHFGGFYLNIKIRPQSIYVANNCIDSDYLSDFDYNEMYKDSKELIYFLFQSNSAQTLGTCRYDLDEYDDSDCINANNAHTIYWLYTPNNMGIAAYYNNYKDDTVPENKVKHVLIDVECSGDKVYRNKTFCIKKEYCGRCSQTEDCEGEGTVDMKYKTAIFYQYKYQNGDWKKYTINYANIKNKPIYNLDMSTASPYDATISVYYYDCGEDLKTRYYSEVYTKKDCAVKETKTGEDESGIWEYVSVESDDYRTETAGTCYYEAEIDYCANNEDKSECLTVGIGE